MPVALEPMSQLAVCCVPDKDHRSSFLGRVAIIFVPIVVEMQAERKRTVNPFILAPFVILGVEVHRSQIAAVWGKNKVAYRMAVSFKTADGGSRGYVPEFEVSAAPSAGKLTTVRRERHAIYTIK